LADETTSDVPAPDAELPALNGVEAAPSAAPMDDFEKALAEYGEANETADNAPAPAPDPRQQLSETREQLDAVRQLGELRTWALDVEQDRLARREKEDTEAVFAKGREYVADFDHLPADFVERWLRAEYSIDPAPCLEQSVRIRRHDASGAAERKACPGQAT
jgi:hypothetical protein